MNFDWSAVDQDRMTKMRRVAEQELAPHRSAETFSEEGWRVACETGTISLVLPTAWGGTGPSALAATSALEAMGQGGADRGLLFALGAHMFGCVVPLASHGSDGQREMWADRLRSGSAIGAL